MCDFLGKGQPAWLVSAMEYQNGKVVLRKDRTSWDVSPTRTCAFRSRELHDHAAMVFEEAAGATLELAHLEPLVGSHS